MPTRRGHTRRTESAITPEAVDAFVANDYSRLHTALGLKPWEVSPIHVASYDLRPAGVSPWTDSFPKALQLRAELEAAVRSR